MEPLSLIQHQILQKWKATLVWTALVRYSEKKMRSFLIESLHHIKTVAFYNSKNHHVFGKHLPDTNTPT